MRISDWSSDVCSSDLSSRFPFLRHLVHLPAVAEDSSDDPTNAAGLESWNDFLARGRGVADAVVDARTASVTAASAGGLFFSSGTTSLPKGIPIGRAHV